jgi:hypothetical protein
MDTPIHERLNIRAFKAKDGLWKVVVDLVVEEGSVNEMTRYEGGESPREFRAWRAMSLAEHYRSGYLDGHAKCGALGPVLELAERITVVPRRAAESRNACVQLARQEGGIVELARFYSFAGAAGTIAARRSTMMAEQYRRGYLDGYENRTTSSYLTGPGASMVDLGNGDSAVTVTTFDFTELRAQVEDLTAQLEDRLGEREQD